ncbi:hypothetical protein URH17368_0672 [Alicyclobacillus hesperidum URH17-3-68]|nr:hypothetical protein URH17368_0672 [Alicyclobacillus hesperidum URH17-3-68]
MQSFAQLTEAYEHCIIHEDSIELKVLTTPFVDAYDEMT